MADEAATKTFSDDIKGLGDQIVKLTLKQAVDLADYLDVTYGIKPAAAGPTLEGETYALGKLLYTQYTLPFEIVSVLLLVAMVGVILLSKKKLE